jgi:acyl-CoA synthetase (AMP-forming)/AMP-acid ligase II
VFYGSTEAGNVASLVGDEVFDHPGSCGVPATSAEVRLTSEGELCVRGPLLFDGYFGDPAATATAVVDGWLHTGDVASLDAAGYLSIVGRVGDLIRTGGEAVAPVEVEAVLAEHPGVGDVAVVGIRDDRWGEVVCAVVVPRDPAAPPSLDELRAHCTGRLAAAKHPRRLHISAELPRTAATGQLQRKAIVAAVNALSIASDGAPTETLTEASR